MLRARAHGKRHARKSVACAGPSRRVTATYDDWPYFLYQSGSHIVFDASLTPADTDGDLIHDEKRSAELATTIK